VDLTWSADEEAFRAEARRWLAENLRAWRAEVGGEPASGDTREGFAQHLLWERRLHADRWAAVSWPEAYGGRGASLWEWLLFEEEYYRAGAPPRVTQNGIFLLAPSIFEFGTPEQQDAVLPRMAAGDDLWCQGWSEPDSGSDLASLSSRARRVDGGWMLDGQKTWTTRGAFCTHLFGLFRTDPDSVRHRGLTYLLVPLDTPGVTVRGFGRLDGDEGFAEVFFDEAFVADDAVAGGVVLGEVGAGWKVAMATTGSERGLTLRSPGRFLATAERLLALARAADAERIHNFSPIALANQCQERETGDGSGSVAVDGGVGVHSGAAAGLATGSDAVASDGSATARAGPGGPLWQRSVDAWMRAEAYNLHTLATVTRLAAGEAPGPEASLTKLWWSELDVALHEVALDALGAEAEVDGPWSKGWQFSLSGPIYAGTNEIQRNITAERLLGLPRA
jgi:alkylation response protein AidB-like acyl-CoA dehydrogenase